MKVQAGGLLVAAFVAIACGPIMVGGNGPAPRYVQVVIPGLEEPLQVSDLTGKLASAELDIRTPPVGALGDVFVLSVPGRPNAVLLGWPGGCETRTDVGIDPPSEPGMRPTFTLKLLPKAEACVPSVARRLIIVFDVPVDAAGFNLDVVK